MIKQQGRLGQVATCPYVSQRFTGYTDMKYNRKSNRLRDYDYASDGYYFVTICTKNHVEYFGTVDHGIMILNDCGRIIEHQWKHMETRYDYVSLDACIVMPDHVHGIIVIRHESELNAGEEMIKGDKILHQIGTGRDLSLREQCNSSRLVPHKIKTLSNLIGAFKTTTSKEIHLIGVNRFAWQRSLYDHIIRNSESLDAIRTYITENPLRWAGGQTCRTTGTCCF